MKSAVKKGDLNKVATAQLIIDTAATTKIGGYNQKLEEIRKNQKDWDHRKKNYQKVVLILTGKKGRHSKNKNEEVTVNLLIA